MAGQSFLPEFSASSSLLPAERAAVSWQKKNGVEKVIYVLSLRARQVGLGSGRQCGKYSVYLFVCRYVDLALCQPSRGGTVLLSRSPR